MASRQLPLVAAYAVIATPTLALACKGPGTMAMIERSERFGWIMFAVAAFMVIATMALCAIRREPRFVRFAWLLVAHPGWWWSARMGDCGGTRYIATAAATVLTALIIPFLLWRRRRKQKKPF